MDEARKRVRQRIVWLLTGVLGLCLCVSVPCAMLPLGAMAVYERVIPPPTFSVKVGATEFAAPHSGERELLRSSPAQAPLAPAPCPPSEFTCEEYPAFFALWRGDPQPDGSVLYRQLWFVYLKTKRNR